MKKYYSGIIWAAFMKGYLEIFNVLLTMQDKTEQYQISDMINSIAYISMLLTGT